MDFLHGLFTRLFGGNDTQVPATSAPVVSPQDVGVGMGAERAAIPLMQKSTTPNIQPSVPSNPIQGAVNPPHLLGPTGSAPASIGTLLQGPDDIQNTPQRMPVLPFRTDFRMPTVTPLLDPGGVLMDSGMTQYRGVNGINSYKLQKATPTLI